MINESKYPINFPVPTYRNPAEKLTAISGIFRAGRKLRGYTQIDVANRLSTSQSWISKVESELGLPNADQWFDACQLFRINSDYSYCSGVIDNCQIAKDDIGMIYPDSYFKVPKKYARSAASRVRDIRPFIRFFQQQLGREALDQFLKSERIDPDFFLVLDNRISIQFVIKLLSELSRRGALYLAELQRLTAWVREPDAHGRLHQDYDMTSNARDVLSAWVLNSKHYDSNYEYSFVSDRTNAVTMTLTPRDHVESSVLRVAFLDDFICRYKKEYFKQFARYGKLYTQDVEVVDRECIFRGGSRCIYDISWHS